MDISRDVSVDTGLSSDHVVFDTIAKLNELNVLMDRLLDTETTQSTREAAKDTMIGLMAIGMNNEEVVENLNSSCSVEDSIGAIVDIFSDDKFKCVYFLGTLYEKIYGDVGTDKSSVKRFGDICTDNGIHPVSVALFHPDTRCARDRAKLLGVDQEVINMIHTVGTGYPGLEVTIRKDSLNVVLPKGIISHFVAISKPSSNLIDSPKATLDCSGLTCKIFDISTMSSIDVRGISKVLNELNKSCTDNVNIEPYDGAGAP